MVALPEHVTFILGKFLKNLLMMQVRHFYSKKFKQEGRRQNLKKFFKKASPHVTYFFPLNLTPWKYLLLSLGYPSRIFQGTDTQGQCLGFLTKTEVSQTYSFTACFFFHLAHGKLCSLLPRAQL